MWPGKSGRATGADSTKLRGWPIDLGIDSITGLPGVIMIGHQDRQRIDALRQAAAKKGRVVRVVDQKTAVVLRSLWEAGKE